MKSICIESEIVTYHENLASRIRSGQVAVDPMFQVSELEEFLEKQRNVNEIERQNGTFDQLASGQGEAREIQSLKNYQVWQLKPEVDICRKFIGYDILIQKFGIFNPGDHWLVFDGAVDINNLETLYIRFNMDHPAGHVGHSPSMSDILELYDESGSSFYYLDGFDLKQVGFESPDWEVAHIQTMQF